MVIWFIGLSQSGKTTLSTRLYDALKPKVPNLVRLDGDVIRDVFGNDVDHTIQGRRKNAERLSHLSRMLSEQDVHVIAAVLSIFPEWQAWNREHIRDYSEVYLKVSLETVRRRDRNRLYERALAGSINNVVGVDIPFPEPVAADVTIDNNLDTDDFQAMQSTIMSLPVIAKALNPAK